MQKNWREIRRAAGVSLHRASADAETTPTTARVFEVGGPDAVTDENKRAKLLRVYTALEASSSPRPAA
jgi:hypothetical protein